MNLRIHLQLDLESGTDWKIWSRKPLLYGKDDQGLACLVVSTDNGGSFNLNVPPGPFYKAGWMNAATGQGQYDKSIEKHNGGAISFTAPSKTTY